MMESATARAASTTRRSSRLRCMEPSINYVELDEDFDPHSSKRTVFSYLIDMGFLSLGEDVMYCRGRVEKVVHTKQGVVCREGIKCSCCNKLFNVPKFQIHAGSKQRKPYNYLFKVSNGDSLRRCARDAWRKQKKMMMAEESNDQKWGYCKLVVNVGEGDGGNNMCSMSLCGVVGSDEDEDATATATKLICCNTCLSAFHLTCVGFIKMHPPDVWHCKDCSCKFCGIATPPLLSCCQCRQKFHPYCIPIANVGSSDSVDRSYKFCGPSCTSIFNKLDNLLEVSQSSKKGCSLTLIRRSDGVHRLLRKSSRIFCNSKVAVALTVMNEFFSPIIVKGSGINVIQNVLYNVGSNIAHLDYSGFFTFILEKEDEIISLASIRIHNSRLAEIPFIGTRKIYRKRGMCKRLLNEIEAVLRSLDVDKLVIPAIPSLEEMWRTHFGFKNLKPSEVELVNSVNIVTIPHCLILVKPMKIDVQA